VDDIILFFNGCKKTIKLVMNTLVAYEGISGQKINKAKSYYLLTDGAKPRIAARLSRLTGMQKKFFQ